MVAKKLQENSIEASEICQFYAGKTILITGAAGFLGTVLLEILLRCCPDIRRIYILLRPKKNIKAADRKNIIINKTIFNKLKATNPGVLEKIIVVAGDTSEDNLGLDEDDFNNITNEVSVVFHVAATVSFVKPLNFVVHQNVISTNNMIDFCRELKKLEVLSYTSSVYSSCNQKGLILEKIYDLPFAAEEVVKLGRYNDEDELLRLYNMCSPPFPNYYTFSKCVSENLLKEKAQGLPVCINRPSIIFNCIKGSLPGYIEEGSAVISLGQGVGTGCIHALRINKDKRMEIIPADVVANSHIVGAFLQASNRLPSPSVTNCVTGELADITWGEFIHGLSEVARKYPIPSAYVIISTIPCKNLMLYNFMSILLHYIPAFIIDIFLWISGSKLRLMKIYKFYDKAMKAVEFFTMHDWVMLNENFQQLSKELNELDKEMFCMDLQNFMLKDAFKDIPTGCEVYRVNGKVYEEKFEMRCLRYILTFLFVLIVLGSIAFFSYLAFFITKFVINFLNLHLLSNKMETL